MSDNQPTAALNLKAVDSFELTVVMDNHVDLLLDDQGPVLRHPRGEELPLDTLLAEHGLCLWLTTTSGKEVRHVLLDTGYSPMGTLHNLDFMGLSVNDLQALVLSHGHMDHTGCLKGLLERREEPLPVFAHPDAFLARARELPDGRVMAFPPPLDTTELAGLGGVLTVAETPVLIAGETMLVSGQVERRTEFEKGMPGALIEREGSMKPDAIMDDMAIIVHVAGRGLVVVSGCAHSGIVNTVLQAQRMTGEDVICAVIGGFHLSGPAMAPAVEPTIDGLAGFSPEVVMPMHCTGFTSGHRIARAFGPAFVLSSVGTKVVLEAAE